jgi:hypothetical protein
MWGFLLTCSKLYLSCIMTHWLTFTLFKDFFPLSAEAI